MAYTFAISWYLVCGRHNACDELCGMVPSCKKVNASYKWIVFDDGANGRFVEWACAVERGRRYSRCIGVGVDIGCYRDRVVSKPPHAGKAVSAQSPSAVSRSSVLHNLRHN